MAHTDEFSPAVNEAIDGMEDAGRKIDADMARATEEISRRDFNGRPVSCHACTEPGCCYQKTGVHFWEVFPIAREIINRGIDTPEFRERLKALGDQMEASERNAWWDSHTPCIFLKNKRCTIYNVRPVNCRTYAVYSPAEKCSEPSGSGVDVLNNGPILQRSAEFGWSVHQALGLKETKKRMLFASLPRALSIFLEAKDRDDWQDFIKRQNWPTDESLLGWFEGQNPIRERLYQIRTPAARAPDHP